MSSESSLKTIILGLSGVFLLSLIALLVINLSNESRIPPVNFKTVPDFKMEERSGRIFGRQDLLGKISVVNFFFSSCQGPCPVMNARVAELYKKFVTSDRVQFVSITVDPQNDSLVVLQKYALRFGVNDQRWSFLRGSSDQVRQLSEQGFMLGASGWPTLHSTKLVLVDSRGNIRGYYDSFNQDSLKLLTEHVRELLKQI